MQAVWYVGVVFAGLGLLVTLFEKEIELRKDLKTEFGIEEENKTHTFTDITLSLVEAGQAV